MPRQCISCNADIVVGKVLHQIEYDFYEVEINTECIYCKIFTKEKKQFQELFNNLQKKNERLKYLEERLKIRKIRNKK